MSSSRVHCTFTGAAGLFRDHRGFADAVVREPATKTAAAAQLVQSHLVLRQDRAAPRRRRRRLRRLRRGPDLDAVALEPGRAVLRLEVRVRDVVIRVERLDRLAGAERGVDVAGLAEHLRGGLRRERFASRDGAGPTVVRRFALVPLNLELPSSPGARPRSNPRRSPRPTGPPPRPGMKLIGSPGARR